MTRVSLTDEAVGILKNAGISEEDAYILIRAVRSPEYREARERFVKIAPETADLDEPVFFSYEYPDHRPGHIREILDLTEGEIAVLVSAERESVDKIRAKRFQWGVDDVEFLN